MNRTLWEKSEAMRLHASCPQSWWNFAIVTAVHVYNRTPLRRTKWKTPVENLTGKKPDVSYFKIFGTKAWVYIPHESRENKLTPKSEIMTFIGYEQNAKAYRFMTHKNQLRISTQAEFDETKFPRAKTQYDNFTKNLDPIRPIEENDSDNPEHDISNGKPDDESDRDIPSDSQLSDDDLFDFKYDQGSNSDSDSDKDSDDEYDWNQQDDEESETSFKKEKGSSQDKGDELDRPIGAELDQPMQSLERNPPVQQYKPPPKRGKGTAKAPTLPTRQSERLRKTVIKPDNAYGNKTPIEIEKEISEEQDVVRELIQNLKVKDKSTLRLDVTDRYALRLEIRQHIYTVQSLYTELHHANIRMLATLIKEQGDGFKNFLLAQAIPNIPEQFKDVEQWQYRDVEKIKHADPESYQQWRIAMDDEIKSLNERKVWTLTELPSNCTPIKCRWVYIVKSDGRKKARLVAKGFSQRPGIDYDETFSPVARYETIRLLLAISVLEKWDIEALDVKTAFLYGDIEADIYMQQPEGYIVKGQENKVCLLKKALYGLKQASYAWNKQAKKSLEDIGFKQCSLDSGAYVRSTGITIIVCIVYVDDILFMGNSLPEIIRVKKAFMTKWECRDLGK